MGLMIILILVFFLLLGYPMFMPMTVGALVIMKMYAPNIDLVVMAQQYITGVSTYVLLAIPMFIFAADIMSKGYTSNRLVDLVKAYCGHLSGGLAVTIAGACTIFGAISGSANATVVAIGKPMRQKMIENGYTVENTDALIVSSATIAALIPPSINMIMYCVLTGTSVGELFMAGIIPGLLVFLAFAVYNYIDARKSNILKSDKLTIREKLQVTRKSLLSLGFPAIIVGGIYSGIFSPTEAAAVAVLYAVVCEMIIYKTVKLSDLKDIALSTGIMTATVFILISAGQAFTWMITFMQIPQMLTTAMLGVDPSAIKVIFVVTLFFFMACMFVDQIVAMLILLPIFFPVAMSAGIDPIYLGIIVSVQAAIGSVTPPFGSNIFVACAAFDRPYMDIIKGLPAYLIMFFIISLMIIFIPEISTAYRLFM
ncbi:TRAP transporter, DctM subunit [Dethiosulfatibacter aminovorans DSM 17477]|uniref:TRAP transporter, DctM subunit n=1 Tax=Dethiosulfatibacter aminovorans DSM 17477 TaxID=1121476 RepID=A0A1M6HUP5_9FIRM|nr:TRAP transporter large permease [Dethiosulfatibacter aminovorans]SHJ25903.1 TRAP transporter, DctM subunit [Dethiosulfatibacter aminovorans DSM 17477]